MAIVAGKIDSFCINDNEDIIYAGNNSGEILLINVSNWQVINRFQANFGNIVVITLHKTLPYIASLGMDRTISILEILSPNELKLITKFSLRSVEAWNDVQRFFPGRTEAQPLAFHPTEKKLVTKNASSALLEISFENDKVEIIHCTRMHSYSDLMTVLYHTDNSVLSGSQGKVILSNNKVIINEWDFFERNIHWFEPIEDNIYLIASDEFRVFKFDVTDQNPIIVGPIITKDDLEHVTYNKVSKRAFIAGFDRNVYEININDCTSMGIVFEAPFKMRWIKTLENNPDILIIQCRNGGLYKVSLSEKKIIATIKETPESLWTSDFNKKGDIILGGDGSKIHKIEIKDDLNLQSRIPLLEFSVLTDALDQVGYTKRLVVDNEGNTYIGRTDGKLYVLKAEKLSLLTKTGSAIRDLAFNNVSNTIFVALESGMVLVINASDGKILESYLSDNNQPIWSIAFNPKRKYLVMAENGGLIHIIDIENGNRIKSFNEGSRPKRMKWISDDILLFNRIGDLMMLNCENWELKELTSKIGNTIEDFIVDLSNNYLLMISYTHQIILCDLNTGEILDETFDQCDYSKGISWLYNVGTSGRQYPLDFLTYGRSGECHLYRIQDEAIFSLSKSIG
jgi:WD40 repeat protein